MQAYAGVMRRRYTRRQALAGLGGSLLAGPGRNAVAAGPGLAGIARARGLHFGCAVTARHLGEDAAVREAILAECAILVAENEMKWHQIEPVRGSRQLAGADAITGFATRHGIVLRGHALVWPSRGRLPAWIEAWPTTDKAGLERALAAHIGGLAGRYRGRIAAWDVVNEGLEARDGRADGLRRSVLLDAFAERYFDLAFGLAREADPTARLAYNDYGIEHAIPWQVAKRRALLALLERLRSRGVPVQALGIQAHLSLGAPFDAAAFGAFLDSVAALGLVIEITELDVDDRAAPGDIARRDAAAADQARRFLDAALARRAVTSVLTWGLTDRTSWLNAPGYGRPRADGLPQRPLPLDPNLARKPLWHAIAAALAAAPER